MLVCRKCQAQHPDGTRTCSCGADLRRDGITIADRSSAVTPAPPRPSEPPLPPLEPQGPPPSARRRAPEPAPADEASGATGTGVGRPPATSERVRRGVEPGELARLLDRPPSAGGAPSGPLVRRQAAPPVVGGDPSARGRGAAPEEIRPPDDPDRPNVHGDPAPAVSAEEADTAPRPAKEGETACHRCLEPNPDSRRFCQSCGETLPAFHDRFAGIDDDLADEEAPPRNTLWRRLTGTTVTGDRDNRTWKQRARDAGHKRVRYETGLSPRTRAAMAAGGLGIVAIAVLAIGPLRPQLTGLFDRAPAGRSPVSATGADPGSGDGSGPDGADALPGFRPAGAIDGDDTSGVAFVLDDAGLPSPEPLTLTLEEATTVEEMVLLTGLHPDHEESRLFPRPSVVEVCAEGGACTAVPLQDSADEQRVPVPGLPATRALTLRVQAVHLTLEQFVPVTVIREVRVVG